MSQKLKVAITGGIGSGKSTFADFLKQKGFSVLDADQIAKDILTSDEEVIKEIKKKFGEQSYLNGKLNRKFVASKVFNEKQNVKAINLIVHPRVIEFVKKKMDELLRTNSVVFVEAALIFEAGMNELFDLVLLLVCDDEIKLKRIIERDKAGFEEIKKRLDNQLSDNIKEKKADFIFKNESTKEDLYKKAEFFLKLLPGLN